MPVTALLLSLLLPAQAGELELQPVPVMDASWAVSGPPTGSDALQISGAVELDRAAAQASARLALEEWAGEYGESVLESAVERARPAWVPGAWMTRIARDHIGSWTADDLAMVVDQDVITRQHEFGQSYQVTLELAERTSGLQRFQRQVQSAVHSAERVLLLIAGGSVVYWATLFLLMGWFDRLTRGYMTRRLALLGVLAAIAVPPLPFLV